MYCEPMTDRDAFEAATLPLLDNLYQTAIRMVHDHSAAEQCIRQTYREARNTFYILPSETDYRVAMFGILFRILHHRGRDWSKLKRWFAAPVRDEILRAVDAIPEACREVLLLADVEGFSRAQIQGILEVSAEAVDSRLAEGRARLRAALGSGSSPEPAMA